MSYIEEGYVVSLTQRFGNNVVKKNRSSEFVQWNNPCTTNVAHYTCPLNASLSILLPKDTSKLLFGILKVYSKWSLVFMPVLFGVTFVIPSFSCYHIYLYVYVPKLIVLFTHAWFRKRLQTTDSKLPKLVSTCDIYVVLWGWDLKYSFVTQFAGPQMFSGSYSLS